MDAEAILELWVGTHGRLTAPQQQRFLARPEIAQLATLPERAVSAAIGRTSELASVQHLAEECAWWFRGDDCDDDYLPFCSRCKPHPATVHMTTGWSNTFHPDT